MITFQIKTVADGHKTMCLLGTSIAALKAQVEEEVLYCIVLYLFYYSDI